MKRAFLFAATALLAASAATAEAKKPAAAAKKPAAPKTVHCAVMPEDKVNVADATKTKNFSDYKGNRYFFCCPGCKPAFEKNPEKYAKAEHVPIAQAPKAPK